MKSIILRWLPGIGKSTWARAQEGYKIISLDNIRKEYPYMKEWQVHDEQANQIRFEYNSYNDIIVDNTHMSQQALDSIKAFCESVGYEVSVKDFMAEESSPRNAHAKATVQNQIRVERVPQSVIDRMFLWAYNTSVDEWRDKIYIFDIDGTIANIDHRLHYVEWDKKDRHSFFCCLHEDKPYKAVVNVMNHLANDLNATIVLVSWRPDKYDLETERRLQRNNIPYDYILMRKSRDKRPDTEVKEEIYHRCLEKEKEKIVCVFDDRQRLIDMRRSKWLYVFNCSQKLDNNF